MLIFELEPSLSFVSEIAMISGRVSTVNKTSFSKDIFLARLRVLQCRTENPFCVAAFLNSLPDFLIEEYLDSKWTSAYILMRQFCLATQVYLYTYPIYPLIDHLTGRSKSQ